MEFPIFAREVQQVLRKKSTFLFAFLFLILVALSIPSSLASMSRNSYYLVHRERLGRNLSNEVLFFIIFGLGAHAALTGAATFAGEREKKRLELLATAPYRGWLMVVEKLLAPLAIEFVFLFAILPVFSIVFLLGGVPIREFLEMSAAAGLVILTATLMGMAVSSRSATTLRATVWSIGLLVSCYLFLILCSEILSLFGSRLTGRMICGNFIVLDLLLFLVALRGARWSETGGGRPGGFGAAARRRLSRVLAQRKRGRTKTWQSGNLFEQLEARALFPRGIGKPLLLCLLAIALSHSCLVIAAYRISSMGGGGAMGDVLREMLVEGYVPVVLFLTILMIVGCAATAIHRERERDTAIYLLSAPIGFRTVLHGKWAYYRRLSIGFLCMGWAIPMAILVTLHATGMARLGDNDLRDLWFCVRIAFFIPLISLASILGGALSKQGLIPIYSISLFALMLILMFPSQLFSSRGFGVLEGEALLVLFLYVLIPYTMVILTIIGLFRGWGSFKTGSGLARGVTPLVILVLIGLTCLDWSYSFLGGGFWRRGYEQELLQDIGRWIVLPLCAAHLLWDFLASRPRPWWVKHLLKGS